MWLIHNECLLHDGSHVWLCTLECTWLSCCAHYHNVLCIRIVDRLFYVHLIWVISFNADLELCLVWMFSIILYHFLCHYHVTNVLSFHLLCSVFVGFDVVLCRWLLPRRKVLPRRVIKGWRWTIPSSGLLITLRDIEIFTWRHLSSRRDLLTWWIWRTPSF